MLLHSKERETQAYNVDLQQMTYVNILFPYYIWSGMVTIENCISALMCLFMVRLYFLVLLMKTENKLIIIIFIRFGKINKKQQRPL